MATKRVPIEWELLSEGDYVLNRFNSRVYQIIKLVIPKKVRKKGVTRKIAHVIVRRATGPLAKKLGYITEKKKIVIDRRNLEKQYLFVEKVSTIKKKVRVKRSKSITIVVDKPRRVRTKTKKKVRVRRK